MTKLHVDINGITKAWNDKGEYIGRIDQKGRNVYRVYVPQGDMFQPVAPSYKTLRAAIVALQAMNDGINID